MSSQYTGSQAFNLAPLVDACFATVESMVRVGKVRLTKEVPLDLPEVASDLDKLKQIIINLLSNALKFTEEGEVRLSATLENASLRIAVSDTGIGISSNALECIFDEFRQVDGSSTARAWRHWAGAFHNQKVDASAGWHN